MNYYHSGGNMGVQLIIVLMFIKMLTAIESN